MKVYIIDYHKDDPKRCTGKKLVKLKIAEFTRVGKGVVLDPFAQITLSNKDKDIVRRIGITIVDTSWNNTSQSEFKNIRGEHRRIPILFAGNPIHYGIAYKLSSIEALIATLYIVDEVEEAIKLSNVVKWGHTFIELNKELLEAYKNKTEEDIKKIEREIIEKILEK
ncbi:DUF367 family protein [Saccharolobus solfataricus]|uniref:16S rRNA aminocarboxypropyltransferase n=4 Tax=Saccharolobus solfataricus TaxID=2287 RepID=TSR3_SACS2|nr:DUF367 family protein [Saccharolobus solfataricus]Q9UWV6.2 RecName: Full=16S rRNA aminocarboxypropyltransferase; AltName: Full=20S S rRNA accumulation protein 3 homolog; Short=SsTsr3 [Saccharolobus solfataricus P2]5AP8_A Chain A, Tsr3 [Saccharolobus solfataricus]5AP8_B Chain B, Tsr3 [Saccharolobus solfataricus]5AP8_C Chain C, Tsr3 [Saccharolobus solfataricus]AKA75075.1 DUF367 family protein [Saccharolobus solfataricus]AKA77768.1 DUF367 family protein [Saccharolobus solfataricus]AKA80461.1